MTKKRVYKTRKKEDVQKVERTPEELLLLNMTTVDGAFAIFQDAVKAAYEASKGVKSLGGFRPLGDLTTLKGEVSTLKDVVEMISEVIKQNLEGRRWSSGKGEA